MKNKEYIKITKHYENCLKKFGDNHKGVDWPNSEDAKLRYRVMLEIIPVGQKCSILDFGCGTAHLYEFIINNNYKNIQYSGLDISKNFIKVCINKFPEVPFCQIDILDDNAEIDIYDYIILNGVFTEKRELTFDEMFNYFRKMIKRIFLRSRYGIAFNVMSKHVDWEREDLFHLPFDMLVSFLKEEISRHFVIRNDYGLYEYTVYVYKKPNQWHK